MIWELTYDFQFVILLLKNPVIDEQNSTNFCLQKFKLWITFIRFKINIYSDDRICKSFTTFP
jgi:hypothetical protein